MRNVKTFTGYREIMREINFNADTTIKYDFLAFIFPSRELKSDENWGCHNNMITIEIDRDRKKDQNILAEHILTRGIGEKFISSRRQTGFFCG